MSINERMRVVCAGADGCHDRRLAGSTEAPPSEVRWKRLGVAGDVPPHGMKAFSLDGLTVLVVDLGNELVAVQSLCPHEAIPLELGVVEGPTLTCLEHMWQFDVRSGAPLGEATEGLQTFSLRNVDGDLYVAVE
ncbi:MAG TPA: Rieske 2Fe-2S domain-containing protein [Polyangia bacterium]|jgi:toluene monooxygenase system ferredoxin subunit|nr:Rieske 2Fe-2S domain-containing protein [Polyangia bacterium]